MSNTAQRAKKTCLERWEREDVRRLDRKVATVGRNVPRAVRTSSTASSAAASPAAACASSNPNGPGSEGDAFGNSGLWHAETVVADLWRLEVAVEHLAILQFSLNFAENAAILGSGT
jgi:hypothetical protein